MAHERIRELPCYLELHNRIVAGIAIPEVARWLQEEQQAFTESKRDSVIRALFRYKADIPAKELDLVNGAVTQQKLEEIEGDIKELDELTKLYRLQFARIQQARKLEETIGFPNQKLAQDFLVAKQLLLDMAELKFKLGIYSKTPENVNVNHVFETQKAIDALPPEDRRRAGELAQTLLKGLLAPVIDASAPAAEEADYEIVETSNGTPEAP